MGKLLLSAVVLVGVCATSWASATYVNPLGEWNADSSKSIILGKGILDRLYGLENLERIDDAGDQTWINTSGKAMAIAKVAGYEQNLGYQVYGSNTFNLLATFNNVTEGGSDVWYSIPNPPAMFHFADNAKVGNSDKGTFSSNQAYNTKNQDHMVTWLISDKKGNHSDNTVGNYVIGFEDLNWGDEWSAVAGQPGYMNGSDRDYNDLVCEVSGVKVPEPGTLSLFLLGLSSMIGMGWIRRKKTNV